MNKIVGVTELQRNFKHVFDEVTKGKSAHILTRKSRPEAVLMPYEEYLRLAQLSESEVTARFQRILARMRSVNARYSDQEIEHDLAQEALSQRKVKRSHARRH
ncbi:MAG: type II toxin-antitoxin system Phd/YefM family antitoxin [Chloroflexi bacterium]|nr:type II toxin-antitoxin system Phd/YefM family antitoxin [Chloroflexota bacterium]MCL5274671.1 type II toxin-antitoxin system Phd/YefM family antitoxin [Chloroflexota bacterium]